MQNCVTTDVALDYIRMISYTIIVLSSLKGIFSRKFSNLLFVGDILMAVALFGTLLNSTVFNNELTQSADSILTPAAVLWAIIHYIAMLKA
jgi:hypothetical protein